MSQPLAVIVLAAGLGTRTKVSYPKVLLPLCGRSLVATVLHTVSELNPEKIVAVLHHQIDEVEDHIRKLPAVITDKLAVVDQGAPKGTGHAVQRGMTELEGFQGDILIVYGDVPLITADTLSELRRVRGDGAASLLTSFDSPPEGMGRILRDETGRFVGIREQKDCTADELLIEEFNAGIYCFDGAQLPAALASLRDDNAQGELYLTDTGEWLLAQGETVETLALEEPDEVNGVNTLADLALVRALMQERIHYEHLANGVLIEDPATTFIDQGVTIGRNTTVLPCTAIRTGVTIGEGCEIGPFAHLRGAAEMCQGSAVGNFVEVKKSTLGKGTKAKHLTYLGDTTIGEKANIGAGTITANYDGKHKHPTVIGDGAFVGSGTVLVAPTTIGKRAMTGAGAVVVRNTNVADGEVVVGIPARPLRKKPAESSGEG